MKGLFSPLIQSWLIYSRFK